MTNEHIPTEAPAPEADYKSEEKETGSEEGEEEKQDRPEVNAPTNDGAGGNWGSHFEYKENPKQNVEYQYTADDYEGGDDYEEDDRGNSRVRREARQGKKLKKTHSAPRPAGGEGRSGNFLHFFAIKNFFFQIMHVSRISKTQLRRANQLAERSNILVL